MLKNKQVVCDIQPVFVQNTLREQNLTQSLFLIVNLDPIHSGRIK